MTLNYLVYPRSKYSYIRLLLPTIKLLIVYPSYKKEEIRKVRKIIDKQSRRKISLLSLFKPEAINRNFRVICRSLFFHGVWSKFPASECNVEFSREAATAEGGNKRRRTTDNDSHLGFYWTIKREGKRERRGSSPLINEIEACHAPFRASRDIGLHAARVNEKGVKLSGY